MAVLLITYKNGKQPNRDFERMIASYKHVQLTDWTYAIETFEGTRTVYNKLSHSLKPEDQLFIITVTKPFTGKGLEDTKLWLFKHLPQI